MTTIAQKPDDTRTIRFNKPPADGWGKFMDEGSYRGGYLAASKDLEDSDFISPEKYEGPRWPYDESSKHPSESFLRFLARGTTRTLVNLIAAAQINFVRLSSDPQWTVAFDAETVTRAFLRSESRVTGLSAALVQPRSDVQRTSWIAPSGAYLTCLELFGEDTDGQD